MLILTKFRDVDELGFDVFAYCVYLLEKRQNSQALGGQKVLD